MKILSWNINGLKKNWDTLLQLMAVELPEIVCIQNYRAHNYDHPYLIDLGLPKDENIPDGEKWVCNYSRITANVRTSNGVAVFTRWAFAQSYSTYGKFDENNRPVPDTGWVYAKHAVFFGKGRLAVFDFQYFTLITVLTPSGSQNPQSARFAERVKFDGDLRRFVFDLKSTTPVLIAGDFKVAVEDIDVHPLCGIRLAYRPSVDKFGRPIPADTTPKPPYVPLRVNPEHRRRFRTWQTENFYDALRLFTNRSDVYTCWNNKKPIPSLPKTDTNRELNQGWRTDYFVTDWRLKNWLQDCTVLSNVMGSRNAPIKLVLELPEPNNPPPPPPLEPEVENRPDLPVDPTYTEGDPSNPYFVPPGE